ncbi:allantoate amidohydrolase [Larsenimonas suaedae]|uniref:Allantoate amidohydrolase n=1 Tax=Larsenimonas suaedae TaxID=1851019 RepID=A0ABU1GRE4_9GAMM|nr:allantoate amidohydrolase [Larsenimonas suaedae]MCM2972601.1 allantoate amidohydrolase [Larsenimonas suaedae]MDR5894603.1 allantoate amidohydrolase [Larsenimonas suaedae]
MHNGEAIVAACHELAAISSDTGQLTRCYLTPEHARANALLAEWMVEAGMTTWQDAAGNQWGRFEGRDPALPALVLGSHSDSVINAGHFDGPLGVLLAIAVVARLNASCERPARSVEVVAFADEEGTRFGTALLGSRAVAGTWDPAWWDIIGRDGLTLRQAFFDFGLDPARIGEAARTPESIAGYLEAHIEQGPVLEAERRSLGVVTAIAGARRFQISIGGEAGHAGTTPLELRRDALAGAAEAIVAIETLARAAGIVATVGSLETYPGAVNVIPGEVRMSLDIRAERDEDRDRTLEAIQESCGRIGESRGLAWRWHETHAAPAVACAPRLIESLSEAIGTDDGPVRHLTSGAGHDGMAMAHVCDIGMLFVRCYKGISHHPDESVQARDVSDALEAMTSAVTRLAG